jgi:hypothetical protein
VPVVDEGEEPEPEPDEEPEPEPEPDASSELQPASPRRATKAMAAREKAAGVREGAGRDDMERFRDQG